MSFIACGTKMAVYDHSGEINRTEFDTTKKRKTRSRRDGTTVADRIKMWKEYNDTVEESPSKKRKVPAKGSKKGTSSRSEVCTVEPPGAVRVKTEDVDCESRPFFVDRVESDANAGEEEMKRDLKGDDPGNDWLSELEQECWTGLLEEKQKLKEQEIVAEETCQKQPDSLSVSDYGWPADLYQNQWDSSEMFDVAELLGDLNGDILHAWTRANAWETMSEVVYLIPRSNRLDCPAAESWLRLRISPAAARGTRW
ncbi:hypothetical protein Bca52824_069727 [Brassica carinata]|uniref:Uncharacterized protein n=1 Tax=Brassica carinata TaxID=52824 RepID=A0A8X7Q490_BRACI|nr:hypothetical protein Bca52824_069727 [Brassica carinata]